MQQNGITPGNNVEIQPKVDKHLIAAVDLGSNSFHMIVAREVDGQLQIRDRLRETVRLAEGLGKDGRLGRAARKRALECLERFGQRLQGFAPGSVRAVGTNTLRKARSPGFLRDAEEALGYPIEIIAGVEEARLIYLGVSHGLPYSDDIRLIIDIGGGSTEVILGRRFQPLELESLYMGCVSYSETFFPRGKVNEDNMRAAVIAARQELQILEGEYRNIGWAEAVGASGTIKSVAEVVRSMGWCEDGISMAAIQRLAQELVAAGHVKKVSLQGLAPERQPVLAGGVAVLLALFESLQLEKLQVSEWALREGLLYDLLGRIRHEDVRERTITHLIERYHVDTTQAERVESLARNLLAQVAPVWDLQEEEHEHLLLWAARLHEIGLAIAHSSYHKHGAYLLANSDMPGFSNTEQASLSLLVRAHRRKFPEQSFLELKGVVRRKMLRLALILRIAAILQRSHSQGGVPEVRLDARAKGLRLVFPSGWLKQHPLTMADLEQEAEHIRETGYRLKFR